VKLTSGSVKVQGGSQAGITYVIHRKAYTSSEEQARREFESNRISASIKGDTAVIVAESRGRDRRCSDEFVINVPRNIDSAKIETGGGDVSVTAIAGMLISRATVAAFTPTISEARCQWQLAEARLKWAMPAVM